MCVWNIQVPVFHAIGSLLLCLIHIVLHFHEVALTLLPTPDLSVIKMQILVCQDGFVMNQDA